LLSEFELYATALYFSEVLTCRIILHHLGHIMGNIQN